ncbi:type II secretion system inner membrane protein GspF [Rehaibacterium terrae]|jgi:general secretion pathway protein F|uniref:General secretion pathway protein F n=1 Tax=Rehaibacterium terrae TaxID=1341696 RepID=A0A7W7V7K6_9GAMM|nr:type II secretion system inner membrane protein GspF [Rehaibacterium terrae]MBB5014712.1 general secretion pathway protein F [Rehaibacterium terrae]
MPAFEYQALDTAGRTEKGVLQADTARAARAALRERGLTPLAVDEVEGAAAERARLAMSARVLFTRQLATLVRAGLPLDEALAAVAEGAEGRTRAVALSLRARVMEGASLAQALGEFPGSFDALYRATVAAGERSGRLDTVLLRLAAHLESRDALRRKLIGALTYPALLLAVSLLVVTGLLLYVVPEVTGVFARSGQALPWATRLLLLLSDGLRAHAVWLLPLSIALGAALAVLWRRPAFAARRDALWLRLPGIGRLLAALETARFARTLALLGGSAVPLLDALTLAAATVRNRVLRAALDGVAARVREGAPLSRALAQSGHFPPLALRLIASGERAGRLDAMLDEAADQLERELDTVLGVAMAALGPAVILFVGGLVLFIVLAILLPIFQMNQLIR